MRELNFYQEGDLTHFNQALTSCHIQRIWDELIDKSHYEERRRHVESFNRFVQRHTDMLNLSVQIASLYTLIFTFLRVEAPDPRRKSPFHDHPLAVPTRVLLLFSLLLSGHQAPDTLVLLYFEKMTENIVRNKR